MKLIYIIVVSVVIVSEILSANAANYNRVERQVINTNQITNQVSRIIETITRYSNPRNMFQWLSRTFNNVMRVLDPSNVLGRGRREIKYTQVERNLHDYLVKASNENNGRYSIKIQNHDDFNWKVTRMSEQAFPELPPIPGITTNYSMGPAELSRLLKVNKKLGYCLLKI